VDKIAKELFKKHGCSHHSQGKQHQTHYCILSIIIDMGTVFSNRCTAEAAPQECDTPPAIPIDVIAALIQPFVQDDRRTWKDVSNANHELHASKIPINVISDFILRYVDDRPTWNAICGANHELHEAGMSRTPPWPQTTVLTLEQSVTALKFSPCGSFLAAGTGRLGLVYICDRRGRQTCLTGHTSGVLCLSFSNDGKYLASASSCSSLEHNADKSIRIWPTDSTTRLPQQSDKTLRGHRRIITCLDFLPADSNILTSGDERGVIKLWNVEQEICLYSFDHRCGCVMPLYFPAVQDDGNQCIFVGESGSLIRTRWNDPSDIESDIVNMPGLGRLVWRSAFSNCGSLLAAASSDGRTVTLHDMQAMSVKQRLFIPPHMNLGRCNSLAFSPNGKTLVLCFDAQEIQICKVSDLNINSLLQPDAFTRTRNIGAVAFDPSGQFLASTAKRNVRLWTL
jgi:WD40 repeat protein